MKPKICMVGSAMTDLISRVPRFPEAGETLVGSEFNVGFGGKGSNQAVMAARLGAEVSVVVKLGGDVFGENYLKNYQEQGIHTDFVFFDKSKASGVAPISVNDETGQNIVIIVPGANDSLSVQDVKQARASIEAADVLICQLETPVEATLEAFRLARASSTLTLLNPAPARDLPDELLALSDVFVPNEVEAAMLSKTKVESVEDAKAVTQTFLAKGLKNVIVTLGEKGVVFASQNTAISFHEAQKVNAVDSTGAGDAFVGSLAYFLASNWELSKAVARASAIATRSVLKAGTQTSYPYRTDVEDLLT